MKPDLLNILVPTDFSEASKTAIRLAIEWSAQLNAKLTVVHAYRLIKESQETGLLDARALKNKVEAKCRLKFEALQDEIDFSPVYEVEFRLDLGFIYNSVKNIFREQSRSIILFGIKPERLPHSYDSLIKMIKGGVSPIFMVHKDYDPHAAETLKALEDRSIFCSETKFLDDPGHCTRKIERAHNQLLVVHAALQRKEEILSMLQPITTRIANFN